MIQKIFYTILGVAIALIFIPRSSHDSQKKQQGNILGLRIEAVKATPEFGGGVNPPQISAHAAFAYDLETQSILFAHNFDEKFPIASLTKLMTAIIVVENSNPDALATVKKADTKVVGNNMGLVAGEQITIRDLLKGMLISSNNDAALVLANLVGPSQEKFTEMMNQKAEQMGLGLTKFSNPVGWDYADNYSSAQDLSVIVNEFLKYDVLSEIVKIKETEAASVDGKVKHKLVATNKLLFENHLVTGIKTGFTQQAKGNLILRVGEPGREVITIILGSDNREQDSSALLEWLFKVYHW